MTASWRTVRVFISSTFRDMHAERDHLVRFVFPRLREVLVGRRVRLVDVDLRWGVTSEEDAGAVCRQVIDDCRPRFIGLLGERYGTVLPGQSRSVTADEIHYGVLDYPGKVEAFFYFRADEATAQVPDELAGDYREPGGSRGGDELQALKSAIRGAGFNAFTYPAQWDAQRRRFVHLEAFGERVYRDMLASLDDEFGAADALDLPEFVAENAAQEQYVADRQTGFVEGSRKAVLDDLEAWALGEGAPLRGLVGASGSGKSALLARLCQRLSEAGAQVVAHFVGASRGSGDLRLSLRRLCHALGHEQPPSTLEELKSCFAELLSAAPRRVIIVLDAVNEMDPADAAWALAWVPSPPSGQVRILISSVSGHAVAAALERRLDALDELGPFSSADAQALFEQYHRRYHKQLDTAQQTLLLSKAESDLPLYLSVALDELRTLGQFETLTEQIEALPETTRELFLWVLQERLARDPDLVDGDGQPCGAALVRRCMSCLGVSRHGLSQAELVALCDPHDPRGNVAAVLRWLRPYLMLRGEMYDFAHTQLREVVGTAYLGDDHQCIEAHGRLADFFVGLGCDSPRGVSERAHHLTAAGEWDRLTAALTELRALETKVKARQVFDLATDLRQAWQAMCPEHPWCENLRLLDEALRRHLEFIDLHRVDYPVALFQCLWNEAWWYDAPEAELHYVTPECSSQASSPPWHRPEPKLCTLLARWRAEKEAREPSTAWVRSHRPPASPLGSGETGRLEGLPATVDSLAFSPDGHYLAIVAFDHETTPSSTAALAAHAQTLLYPTSDGLAQFEVPTDGGGLALEADMRRARRSERSGLSLYDRTSGRLRPAAWSGAKPTAIAFGPDSRRLLVGDVHGGLSIVDVESGVRDGGVQVSEDIITAVAWSPNGEYVAAATRGGARVYHAMTFAPAMSTEMPGAAMTLSFSPDNALLAVATSGNMHGPGVTYRLGLWDVATGDCLQERADLPWGVMELAFEPIEGRFIAYGSTDGVLRLWWFRDGERVDELGRHASAIWSIDVSADGASIGTASIDRTVGLWDVPSQASVAQYSGHEKEVICVRFSPDGQVLASGAPDGTVRFWDPSRRPQNLTRRDHRGEVTSLCADRRGWLVTDWTGIAALWDPVTGRQVAAQRFGIELSAVEAADGSNGQVVQREGAWLHVFDPELPPYRGLPGALLRGPSTCVARNTNGCSLAVGLRDGNVALWPQESPKPVFETGLPAGVPCGWDETSQLVVFSTEVRCVAATPGDDWLVAGRRDGSVVFARVAGTGHGAVEQVHAAPVIAVAVCATAPLVATGDASGTLVLWILSRESVEPQGCIMSLVRGLFTPAGPFDHRVWPAHHGAIVDLAFDRDGRRLVSVSRDGTSLTWDIAALCHDRQSRADLRKRRSGIPCDEDTPVPCARYIGRTNAARLAETDGGAQPLPFARGSDTAFADRNGVSVAYYPTPLDRLTRSRTHDIWAAHEDYGQALHIISLAGHGADDPPGP
ncbi:MAG TPA: hypothetical protein DGT21_14625 [Armatimonadetes bacterium]|nr:hypothetical protein [Armatimonadota bacterium]